MEEFWQRLIHWHISPGTTNVIVAVVSLAAAALKALGSKEYTKAEKRAAKDEETRQSQEVLAAHTLRELVETARGERDEATRKQQELREAYTEDAIILCDKIRRLVRIIYNLPCGGSRDTKQAYVFKLISASNHASKDLLIADIEFLMELYDEDESPEDTQEPGNIVPNRGGDDNQRELSAD